MTYYNYSAIPQYNPEADALLAAGKREEWIDIVTNIYKPRYVTDLSFNYIFKKNCMLKVGVNNIFDVYPSIQSPETTESGGMWEATQMGFGGAYFNTQLNYKF
jgi:iron complex outermembrane receptor protein